MVSAAYSARQQPYSASWIHNSSFSIWHFFSVTITKISAWNWRALLASCSMLVVIKVNLWYAQHLSAECKIPCINHFPNSKDLTFSLRAFSFSAAAADRRASTNVAKAGFWVPTAPLEVADEAEAVAAPPPLEVSTVAVVVVVVVTVVVPPVVVVVAAVSVVPFAVPVGALPSFFFSAETEW